MAHPTYKDAAGATRSRKAAGNAGTDADPDVLYNNIADLTAANTARTTATTVLPVQVVGPSGSVKGQALPSVAADINNGADNAAATVTYSATPGVKHYLYGIYFGYDVPPTQVGYLTITDDGTTVFNIPVTAAGIGPIPFDPPIVSTAVNKAMVISLSSGGALVQAYLSCRHEAR